MSDLCLKVEKNILKEIMHFHNKMQSPSTERHLTVNSQHLKLLKLGQSLSYFACSTYRGRGRRIVNCMTPTTIKGTSF